MVISALRHKSKFNFDLFQTEIQFFGFPCCSSYVLNLLMKADPGKEYMSNYQVCWDGNNNLEKAYVAT